MTGDEEVLRGGVAHAAAVIRSGSHVLRPSDEHSTSRLRFLSRLHRAGFEGAPVPIGLEGRERLRFAPGEVSLPPYPARAQSDEALRSVAALIRRLHDVPEGTDRSGLTWSAESVSHRGAGKHFEPQPAERRYLSAESMAALAAIGKTGPESLLEPPLAVAA